MTSYRNYNNDCSKVFDFVQREYVANTMMADSSDAMFDMAVEQYCNGDTLTPVWVRGYDGDEWFNDWPGVGASRTQSSMKAFRTADGRIFRPSALGDRYTKTKLRNNFLVEVPNIPSQNVMEVKRK